ncbi:hypothetical protein C8A00DRAFT_37832 [Chaetomidium leptoderma]|uniref:Uncharacterized protein n=1 Tax=Chaetomidium leptoderma TaxID=669021 RepID=A0AAN6VDW5_9PEZI|nr:hypothetical protein C8A00DRAFT_37832 [Chaetomidium leptoderma]
MSAEAAKMEQTQPEQQQQQQDQPRASTDEKPVAEQETGATAATAEKKPNPLKKVTSVLKTIFGCLRKPDVRELDDDQLAKEQAATDEAANKGIEDQAGDAAAAGEKSADIEQEQAQLDQEAAAAREAKEGTTTVISAQPPTL